MPECLSQMLLLGTWQALSLDEEIATFTDEAMPFRFLDDLIFLLRNCRKAKHRSHTLSLHVRICECGLETNQSFGNYLVLMFVEVGCVQYAQQVFDRLRFQNECSWNSLINGYVNAGSPHEALKLYQKMQIDPSGHTFVAILKACAKLQDFKRGMEIHAEISRAELLKANLVVGNALIDMYSKCDVLTKAHDVFCELPFRDVVSWNALIAGYADCKMGGKALELFEQMQLDGVSPSVISYVCSLKACGQIGTIDTIVAMHADIDRRGFLETNGIVGTSLVDVYAKCGFLAKAQEIFDRLPLKDATSWTALIESYAEQGQGDEAVKCFDKMHLEGVSPDSVAYLSTLKACSKVGAKDKGEEIHTEIERQGLLEKYFLVGTTLVDMYAKCGSLAKAQQVFDNLEFQDSVSWNALLTGYNQVGEYVNVFHIFDKMLNEGIKPDSVTFIVLLNACSRTGLWHKGETFFHAMNKDYGIMPIIDHYACMIDLLGRAGQLEKAAAMIKELPVCPNLVVWHTMLGACRSWGNLQYGKKAFQHVMHLDKKDGSAYVFLCHMYAEDGHSG